MDQTKKVVVVRTFPPEIPPNRDYVVDQKRRFYVQDYNLRGIEQIDADYLVILEWDIAISDEDLAFFQGEAAYSPDEIHVVPYRLKGANGYHWSPWVGDGRKDLRWINTGRGRCDGFGFGCTWIPVRALRDYVRSTSDPLNDTNFSIWWKRGAVVHWSCVAVHLR